MLLTTERDFNYGAETVAKMGMINRSASSSDTNHETTQNDKGIQDDPKIKHDVVDREDGEKVPFDAIKQDGVKKVEALAAVWTKWHLVAAFAKSVRAHTVNDVARYTC